MPSVSRYWPLSGTYSAIGTGWTNPQLVAISDGSDASALVNPTTPEREEGYFDWGFASLIPAGATINQVVLVVRGRRNTQATFTALIRVSGSTVHTFTFTPTVESTVNFDATSFRAWTRTDLTNLNVFLDAVYVAPPPGTPVGGQAYCDFIRVDVDYTLAPIVQAVGRATETDTAQAITRRKTKAVGRSSETELAQATAFKKAGALGQAEETDEAQPLQRGAISADGGFAFFGTGRDLDIVVDTNPFTLADPRDPTANLITNNVLQRAINCRTLQIDAGCVLQLSKHPGSSIATVYPLFVADLLVNAGEIVAYGDLFGTTGDWFKTDPNPASASTAGANGDYAGLGGLGGAGGAGSGGRAGGTSHRDLTVQAAVSLLQLLRTGPVRAGAPGSNGGGDGTNSGGRGGYAGPGMFVAARRIENTDGVFRVVAGPATTPGAGNTGGAGGGGGGVIWVVCAPTTEIDIGLCWASAGSGTAGHGTGAAGAVGEEGAVFVLSA